MTHSPNLPGHMHSTRSWFVLLSMSFRLGTIYRWKLSPTHTSLYFINAVLNKKMSQITEEIENHATAFHATITISTGFLSIFWKKVMYFTADDSSLSKREWKITSKEKWKQKECFSGMLRKILSNRFNLDSIRFIFLRKSYVA